MKKILPPLVFGGRSCGWWWWSLDDGSLVKGMLEKNRWKQARGKDISWTYKSVLPLQCQSWSWHHPRIPTVAFWGVISAFIPTKLYHPSCSIVHCSLSGWHILHSVAPPELWIARVCSGLGDVYITLLVLLHYTSHFLPNFSLLTSVPTITYKSFSLFTIPAVPSEFFQCHNMKVAIPTTDIIQLF